MGHLGSSQLLTPFRRVSYQYIISARQSYIISRLVNCQCTCAWYYFLRIGSVSSPIHKRWISKNFPKVLMVNLESLPLLSWPVLTIVSSISKCVQPSMDAFPVCQVCVSSICVSVSQCASMPVCQCASVLAQVAIATNISYRPPPLHLSPSH